MELNITFQTTKKLGFPFAVFGSDDRMTAQDRPTNIRVLIVEDDYIAASDAEAVLTEAGIDVVGIASSADEAVQLGGTSRPNLAIMDIRLNGSRDGVDAAIELFREHGIRSVFATAHHDAHIRARAEPSAPLGWLAKPYTTNALIAIVRSAAAELKRSK
ncbi:MAG TPA: response regulator [Pseudolabrys sp.]|nr:response regulator [Pseudolabrys sp.]